MLKIQWMLLLLSLILFMNVQAGRRMRNYKSYKKEAENFKNLSATEKLKLAIEKFKENAIAIEPIADERLTKQNRSNVYIKIIRMFFKNDDFSIVNSENI